MPSQITSVRCKYSIGRKKSRRHLAVWVQPHLSRRCPTCPFTAATPHLKPSGLASRRLGGHVPHDSASTLIHQAERGRTASLIHLPTTQKLSCFHHDGIFLQHPSPGRAQQEKLGTSSDLWGSRPIAWAIALPPPSSPSLALSAWLSLLYLSWGLSLSLLQAGCLQWRLLNNRGADSEGVCGGHSGSFLEPYQKSEVTAQGSGWNFALDDLTRLAGASLGTAGVRPGRKQGPACWLLLLPPHPLSPGPDCRQTPAKRVHRGQRAAPSRDAYSRRAQGCVHRGVGNRGSRHD